MRVSKPRSDAELIVGIDLPSRSVSTRLGVGAKEAIVGSTIIVVLLTCFFYDIIFLGKSLRVSNTVATALPYGHFNYPGGQPKYMPVIDVTPALMEEPYLRFKERSFAHGVFPLWNPHQAGGYPFLATPVSSLLFLPEVILYALPSPYDWDVYLLFRLFIAGLSTYLFMRTLSFRWFPSAVAAASYMFSGPVLSFVTGVNLNVDMLLPLFLLVIELILRHNRVWYTVIGSLVAFQAVAGGHPEPTFLLFLTGTLYAVFRLATKAHTYQVQTVIRNLVVMILAGVGLGGIVLMPVAEFVFQTSWHTHSSGAGTEYDGLERAITLMFPWYYSNELVSYRGWTGHTWAGGWIGLLPLWLATFTLCAKSDHKKISYFFLLFVGISLAKVYGLPVINWIGYLPLFDLIRYPLHITRPLAFGIAILSGVAVSSLMDHRENVTRFLLSGVPLALISAVAIWMYPPSNRLTNVFGLSIAVVLAVALSVIVWRRSIIGQRTLAAIIGSLLLMELFALIPRERIQRAEAFQEPPYVNLLKQTPEPFRVYGIGGVLNPNTATAFDLDDIGIYEGLIVKRFADYIHNLVDDRMFGVGSFNAFRGTLQDPSNRFLDLLNLRYLVLPPTQVIPPEVAARFSFRLVYDGEVRVYERLNVFPRAMIRHHADVIAGDAETLERLKGGYDLDQRVIVDRQPAGWLEVSDRPPHGTSSVTSTELSGNHKRVLVRMERAGLLVVNDVNYPGWRVAVDGVRQDLLTANYLFQAVVVPKGEHQITFEFRPLSVQVGLAVSLLAVVFLAILSIREWYRGRQASPVRRYYGGSEG